ncbi:FHA domain-containing protein [Peredibacter starrii]|uniref:FHA domain-containing protein n=1 Tax=Peredibacter starrii TaxID=28202 RepID=A0AAX4HJH6_9BACT|nr:FHA domain-containing protein [Peredibacter starrii]WPU63368.1 FHA domain-containing protein [Peredibacter starrii]
MIRLSVQIEFDKTMDLTTHKNSVVVGRSPKCDLIVPHDSISRQHCQIDYSKEKEVFYITDLGSSNGVTINGQRIPPSTKTLIPPNAALSMGKLECELSNKPGASSSDKVVSSDLAPSGDFTSTIRLARIELNKPSITLELEKKPISKRPRNPVTYEEPVEVVKSNKTKWILFSVGLLILAITWFMAPDKN